MRWTAIGLAGLLAVLPIQAKATDVRSVPNGIEISTGSQQERIQFYGADTIRVLKWTAGGTSAKKSLSVIQKRLPKLKLVRATTPETVELDSGAARAVVNRRDGSISLYGRDKRLLVREIGAASFAPTGLAQEPKAFNVRQGFTLSADEGIYGLGQHQDGYFNYRGKTVKLVQANTAAVTPMLVSSVGYGIFWDNYSKTIFADDAGGASLWSEVGDNVDYYIFAGPTIDASIAAYRKLTGQAPMYGKWAYGYWQSKEHYHTQAEVEAVAQKYRELRIPIDNIIQDWNYWGSLDMWGAMIFDPERYPTPDTMMAKLHKQNFHLIISIWEGLGPSSAIYKDMEKRGYLYSPVGWAGFRYFDAYNTNADDLYWQYAKKGIFSKGVDGWWMDSTEPDIVNALTKESHEFEMKRVENNYIGSFARYLNPYTLAITESVYQHQRKETDQKRVYILTRSTFAGQQRAAATTWSGDIGADWTVYANQIPAGINHSMAGIPYWTFDIGAFSLGCQGGVFSNGGRDPAYQELYTRMFQFGAFAPIFRSHGSETPREIWEFGDYTPVLVKFDNLRYRLMPYIYSLAWQVTHNGGSIMRGLPMDFAGDTKTHNIADQFLFGPAIMVSPVTQPMYHRPPEQSILAEGVFRTPDGQPGLKATYFCDEKWGKVCREQVEPSINLFWYTGWPDFIKGPKFSMRWEGKLVVPVSGTYRFDLRSFGAKKVYLDGREIAHNYDSMGSWTVPLQLEAGKEYAFKFETNNAVLGAFRAQVYWKTPEIHAREALPLPQGDKSRTVYLPAGVDWYDFWTGQMLNGGQTITRPSPIDTMPLMVRAGSIIPMGPFVRYAAEKKADPIELRIYAGANGHFMLYEDENDSYRYEKGVYATIAFHWSDAKHQLTIDARKGKFPGMLKSRTFHIILVGAGHGTGIETTATPNKVVTYAGKRLTVSLR